ncbi:uncharacterized protein A4U43_C10F13310 [Asparagus officinalis]|uniref:Uncharacterized protein n=1 Tax=Asparagus officinalis TaxID=4686 RepID=A0A5P1E5P5_ASPOF|nr:uncharacterized protein A4U43_C10F13310 [Asparagus officinalis]
MPEQATRALENENASGATSEPLILGKKDSDFLFIKRLVGIDEEIGFDARVDERGYEDCGVREAELDDARVDGFEVLLRKWWGFQEFGEGVFRECTG